MNQRNARFSARLAMIASFLIFTAGHLWAQNENESVGFQTNHVFESGHFGENIDILNGGMNLTVPIGQSYVATSRLGFGLKLSYSSKVWDTSDYLSGSVKDTDEIMPYNESPFGMGFSTHQGRIYVDAQYIQGCNLDDYFYCWTKIWYWVSPDGTPHIIYTEDHDKKAPLDPGPPFSRRLTKELSYARVSGPDDSYCRTAGKTKCMLVETTDGLAYTLERQDTGAFGFGSDCVAESVQGLDPQNKITPVQRRDSQDFCGWYTTLIEDRSVGTVGTDGTYANKIKITYDTRSGFKHTIARIEDSSGRTINYSSCEWAQGANGAADLNPITDNKCLPGSMPITGSTYQATNKHAVATYQVQMPAYGGSTALGAATATYRFVYEFESVRRANPDYEPVPTRGVCCDASCNSLCPVLNGPVLKLVRIDYPEPTDPPDQYSLYFGYYNTNLAGFRTDYGEVACRTLPIRRIGANACNVSGNHPRFKYYYDYYEYTAAYLNPGSGGKNGVTMPSTLPRISVTRQIVRKDLEMPAGIVVGTWKYDRGDPTSESNPSQVVVTDAFRNDTIYFYYSSRKSEDPNNKGTNPEDAAAPEWNDGLNYRIDYYEGTGTGRILLRSELQEYDADRWARDATGKTRSKENTRVKRAVTQYVDDGGVESVVSRDAWDGQGHWKVEVESGFDVARPRTTRTDYATGRCSITDSLCSTITLECAAGQSCPQRGTSSCPSGESCTPFSNLPTFTTYMTDLVLVKEVSDGVRVLSRTENDYRRDGRLKVSISRATAPGTIGTPRASLPLDATRQPGDVMTVFTYSAYSGNAMSKTLSTGRTGDPAYTINYTYAPAAPAGTTCPSGECGGYLATKTFAGALFKSIDRDRDANTGLIMATRDTSPTLQTNYAYDVLGRVTQVSPPGEEATAVKYVSLLETTVTQGTRGLSDLELNANFVFTRYLYDGLGRLVATQKRPANPARGFACQKAQYDVANHVIYKTEWKYQPDDGSSCTGIPMAPATGCPGNCISACRATGVDLAADPGTESDFRNPTTGLCDPFGRARLGIPADADRTSGEGNRPNWPHVTKTDYFGTNSQVTVNAVHGAGGTEIFTSTTTYIKDGLGRLLVVDVPYERRCSGSKAICSADADCGASGGFCIAASGADAYYDYDAMDRLEQARLSDNLAQNQIRRFAYDGLGQLLWADNPESGVTVYKAYDALGNVLASQDARGSLRKFAYDFAGRPTDQWVRSAGGSVDKLVVHNIYDESNAGLYFMGRLTTVQSKDESENLLLTERRFYSGIGGRVSTLTHAFADWAAGSTVTTSYSYTTRGQVQTIQYPLESPSNHATLTVNYDYVNGFVLRAWQGGAATALGTVSYNPAGGIETVDMPNGRTQMTFDSRNRPASITGGAWNGTTWSRTPEYDSGTYRYDGSGNIYQIGSNSYGYDAANRLITAHTQYKGTQNQYDETFAYDIYGNMAQRQLTTTTTSITSEREEYTFSTPSTNRIMTRQTTFGGTVSGNAVNFVYDAGGNVLQGGRSWKTAPTDPLLEDIKKFHYGAMNRLLRIQQVGDSTNGTNLSEVDRFQYDAGGNRIWKVEKDAGMKMYYVRDAGAQVLTEFRAPSTSTASPEWSADYVYLAGRLLTLRENLRMRPPAGLRATQTPSGSNYTISVAWDESPEPDRASYKVYRFREGTDSAYALIGQTSGLNLVDPLAAAANTFIRYYVTGVDQSGYESAPPPYLRVMAGDLAGPSAPTGLTTSSGDRTVTLTWTASTDSSEILGYEVNRRLSTANNDPSLPITTQLIKGTSFVDLNLTNGQTYYYRVRAKDVNANWGPLSCNGTPCDAAATPTDLTPPSPPKGVTAVSTCGSQGVAETIMLTWEANPPVGGYTISYDVYRNTQPVFEGLVPPLLPLTSTTATSYTDPGPLTPGTMYYYAIRAVHKSGITVVSNSAFSQVAGASPRDSSITPNVRLFAKATDGAVTLQWQSPGSYLIYRKLNATESCANYVQVASVDSSATSYTDGYVPNNAAYDYALVALAASGKESSFSRPTLAIPLARPSSLFQCYSLDPWEPSFTEATVLQWRPPSARFYQPLLATTTDGTLGFLKGYHLYHHKRCERLLTPPYRDNSPLREVVVDSSRTLDPYLIDAGRHYEFIDPRYLISDNTTLSPTFRSSSSFGDSGSSLFYDCGVNPETNCAMPRAVYKVFAEGTWLTAESDWPDYFNPLEPDPFKICSTYLKYPSNLRFCIDGTASGNPNFVPPPRNLRARAAGPGAIRLDWVAPTIPAGKAPLAGFYLYARGTGFFPSKHSFKSPLPFAVVGPGEDKITLTGLSADSLEFSIVSLDQAGHVSGKPWFCQETGVDCTGGSGCTLSLCSNTKKICTPTDPCSSYGACSRSNAACKDTLPCTPNVCRYSPATACTPIKHVQTKAGGNAGATTIGLTLASAPTNGNALVAVIGTRGTSTGRVSSVSQTGASWTKAKEIANSKGVTAEIWYALNVTSAGTGITVNLAASLKASAVVAEYAGLTTDPQTVVDQTATAISSGAGSTSPTTGTTTTATSQTSEIWIGGMANIDVNTYSAQTNSFTEVAEAQSTGTDTTTLNNTVMEAKIVNVSDTAGVSATLSSTAQHWAGVIATFKAVSYPCGTTIGACVAQTCTPDVCTFEQCQESEGRGCLNDPTLACTRSSNCPKWINGLCNVSNSACDPSSPSCPTAGEVCVPGDRCVNSVRVTAAPGAETVQPGPPASLKTVLWTLNDSVTSSRGRTGIKIAWGAALQSSTIQGFRVYRSTLPEGPYCALVRSGTRTVPLPAGVTECASDVLGRTVDTDPTNPTDFSSAATKGSYWDQTVASERVYYYRVSQIESNTETPLAATYQVAGQELGYDKTILPPPQGFRAWASQSGNMTDLASVVLNWCPIPTTTAGSADVLPSVDEYRVYRTGRANGSGVPGVYRLLAHLSSTCLDAGKRCEITNASACVDSGNNPKPCGLIEPLGTTCDNVAGPRCGIVDRTFTCWPDARGTPVPWQYPYNYRYFVTALGTLSPNPPTESMPSTEDQAWLNYCGDPITPTDCPASPMNCYERRDPDGNGDYLVCGDEDAKLLSPESPWDSEGIAMAAAGPADGEGSLAPHRIIGQEPQEPPSALAPPICTDCGGGEGGGTPPPPPAPPFRFVFYHLDHLGSPRLELDAAGNLVAEHHYLPFGEERPAQVDPTLNTKAFTGHQRDTENGLDYMVARYYGSSLARLLSPDPADDVDLENPQSWNKYAYARNNPVLITDPDGRKIKVDIRKNNGKKDRKANRATKRQMKQAAKADPRLKAKLKALKKSDNVFTITNRKPGEGNTARPTNSADAQNGNGTGGTIGFDPHDNVDPETGGTRDPAVALVHELIAHGSDYDAGTLDQTADPASGIVKSEIKAVRTENIMRPHTGDPTRKTFGGRPVPNPTADPDDPEE